MCMPVVGIHACCGPCRASKAHQQLSRLPTPACRCPQTVETVLKLAAAAEKHFDYHTHHEMLMGEAYEASRLRQPA